MIDRANVLGVRIDRFTLDDAIKRCIALIDAGEPTYEVSVNAAKFASLRRDARLREIIRSSPLVGADGQAVVWASRLLGDPLPERVAGIDLMTRLVDVAEARDYRVFILGARQETLDRALRTLRVRHPGLRVAGHHGYFEDAHAIDVETAISEFSPHVLFVAMGSPQKEYWIAERAKRIGVPLAVGVGGAVDVIAGERRRAPRVIQRMGLEWLFRLLQEPRRLFRRYITTNAEFAFLVGCELVARRSGRNG